jgi:hypothetical protein
MKTVKQMALSLKNQPGAFATVSDLLGGNGIAILAFYVATDGDKRKLYFVSNDPERAMNVLKTAGYDIGEKEVVACEVPRHPGGLNAVLKPLKEAGINLDYLYPCIGTGEISVLILGVGPAAEAIKILEDNWIRILGAELYNM